MVAGTRFAPECDRAVSRSDFGHVTRWTSSVARDNHLYFTSPSLTADGRFIVFLSERTGRVNLFACERASGELRSLSENEHGILHSYCWPWGGHLGLSKASPVLDAARNRVFYIQDGSVLVSEIDAPSPQVVCELPEGALSGFTHVSPDGRVLCLPLLDARGDVPYARNQRDQLEQIPRRAREHGVGSVLLAVDVERGTTTALCEVPFWVTHVQYDPSGSGRIIFNREGERLENIPRIWCLEPDGMTRPLYDQPPEEQATHENFSHDGSMIVYHGHKPTGPFFAARRWDGSLVFERTIDTGIMMHVTPTPDGPGFLMDCYDGTLRRREWDQDGERWDEQTLCRHDADLTQELDQDDHVHPIAHDGGLVFSSNTRGVSDVYEFTFS